MKRLWLKRLLLAVGLVLLVPILAVLGYAAYVYANYKSIVNAGPSKLQVSAQAGEFGRWVDPFIGTGGIYYVCAYNHPGAGVPFGMVRLGPETVSSLPKGRSYSTSGYYYPDNKLLGFSHTRLLGTGATDGGNFLVFPGVEALAQERWGKERFEYFSHADEKAFPGYYAVRLPKPGILAEFTATTHVGVHRYTFSEGKPRRILIDVTHGNGRHECEEGYVNVLPESKEIEGSAKTMGGFSRRYGGLKTYFVARFSEPFASYDTWHDDTFTPGQTRAEGEKVVADVSFDVNAPIVTVKLGISCVSIENARANLDAEAGEQSFDEILATAKVAWEEKLALVKLESENESQKRIFYTALYHSFQMPTVFNDANGDYMGFDDAVHKAEGFRYFTDISIWDTFRTVHPLFTLIAPNDQRDICRSLVKMSEQGGYLPRWPSGKGYTNSMLGTPADILIADTYLKGVRDFDVETAYAAMRKTALEPVPQGSKFSGREGVDDYIKHGYCPADTMHEAVARTMEFGWADSAIAGLAESLGKTEDAALFKKHSEFYRNLWNPETQYFHPRNANGQFAVKFKPALTTYRDSSNEYTDDYVEGSAMHWRWAAPFDAQGMIGLFESKDYFVSELNSFFENSTPSYGAWDPGPYYWHGNEPDMHAAYLFNEAGRPDLTQKWVRWILENKYADRYDGLDGNDDAGTLSAWYVFSALGFYPIAGSTKYQLGAPLFKKAEVKTGDKVLTVVAGNYAPEHAYVNKVWLNGNVLDRNWIEHDEIANGGELRFEMSKVPAVKQ
jgi:predicted alpha-1,2-mannosidase